MKHLLVAFSLFAMMAVGCDTTTKVTDTPTTEVSDSHADHDHSDLVMEVDKDALESAMAANSLTLVDFTATW